MRRRKSRLTRVIGRLDISIFVKFVYEDRPVTSDRNKRKLLLPVLVSIVALFTMGGAFQREYLPDNIHHTLGIKSQFHTGVQGAEHII